MTKKDEECFEAAKLIESSEENEDEKTENPWSIIYVLYFITFLTTSAWTVTYTSLWPYITYINPDTDITFFGWVNCVRGSAAMFASISFGYWCDYRGANEPLIFSNLLFLVGHVIYIFPRNEWVIMAARFLIGLSSGSISLCRTLAAKLCSKEDLVHVMSVFGIVEALAFLFGPLSQLIATTTTKHQMMEKLQKYHINMYTIPVWVLILLGLISFLLQVEFIFCKSGSKDNHVVDKQSKKDEKNTKKVDMCVVGLILLMFFTLMSVPNAFESTVIPALMNFFSLTKNEAITRSCIVVICYTIINVASFAFLPLANKRFNDKVLLLFGVLAVTVGMFLGIPLGPGKVEIRPPLSQLNNIANNTIISELGGCPSEYEWCHTTFRQPFAQFIVYLVIIAIGEAPCFTGTSVLFIKSIGSENQGSYIGWYSGVESLSRIIGPIYGSFMYRKFGSQGVYGGIFAFLMLNLTFYVIFWKRIVPYEEQEVMYEKLAQEEGASSDTPLLKVNKD